MPPDRPLDPVALADAWWQHVRRGQGDRDQRLEAEQGSEAADEIWASVDEQQDDVLDVIDALLSADGADPVLVGAGPLEDLLAADGTRWAPLVAEHCRRSPLWREAVAAVWLGEDERRGLAALGPFLGS